ncbi:hypothetical protein ARUE_c34220 [Arthrobacter sp. Rue61a]|nr:hypothetical protein ARUE_c34220 [Arthrobacter sp. Rue61a]
MDQLLDGMCMVVPVTATAAAVSAAVMIVVVMATPATTATAVSATVMIVVVMATPATTATAVSATVMIVVVMATPATTATAVSATAMIVVVMATPATTATAVSATVMIIVVTATPATRRCVVAAGVVFAVEGRAGVDGCVVEDHRANGVDVGRRDVTEAGRCERCFGIPYEFFGCFRIVEQAHQELHELLCECRHWSAPSNSVMDNDSPGAFAGLESKLLPRLGTGHRGWSPYRLPHR